MFDKIIFWGAAILVLIVIIIAVCVIRKIFNAPANRISSDAQYRKYVYNQAPPSFKPQLRQLISMIDAINQQIQKQNIEIGQAQYNAMNSIYQRANQIEYQIREHWNSRKFNADFYYYIGLHYASHLLGNALKSEQQVIRNTFVECKKRQEYWGRKIDALKSQQNYNSYSQRARIGAEISDCCQTHKQISNLKSKIGQMNELFNQRVTQQNIETGRRRDFIATNFGKKGEDWKKRMQQRAHN